MNSHTKQLHQQTVEITLESQSQEKEVNTEKQKVYTAICSDYFI